MLDASRRFLCTLAMSCLFSLAVTLAAGQEAALRDEIRRLSTQTGDKDKSESEQQEDEEVRIADNSFLIEEAFNQEQGVVQSIFNWIPSWDRLGPHASRNSLDYVFTQEWPLGSQKHQFSYTLPMLYNAERIDGILSQQQGFGDIALNYRYQLLGGGEHEFSCSPRLTVFLPTGELEPELERFLGTGEVGYQFALPMSKEFERWAVNFNATYATTPNVKVGVDPALHFSGRTLNAWSIGGSAIHFVRPNFHLMLEFLSLWEDELQYNGQKEQPVSVILSPGFRYAPFTEGDTQWVVGVGVPVGLSGDAPDIALFLYMSMEMRVAKRRPEPGKD